MQWLRIVEHVSVVHGLASTQLGGVPGVQTPPWQVSAPLHTLPSLHEVPLVTGVFRQPVTGSHESVVHGLASLQFGGVPGWHTPPTHVSTPLQTVESAHSASVTQASAGPVATRQTRSGNSQTVRCTSVTSRWAYGWFGGVHGHERVGAGRVLGRAAEAHAVTGRTDAQDDLYRVRIAGEPECQAGAAPAGQGGAGIAHHHQADRPVLAGQV